MKNLILGFYGIHLRFFRLRVTQKALRQPLFFLFLLLHSVSGRADKSVLSVFHQSAPKMPTTSTELVSLDTLKSVCVRNVPLVHIRNACDS